MQRPLTNGRTGFASACRDIPADWRRWTSAEKSAALAMLTIVAAVPAALFGAFRAEPPLAAPRAFRLELWNERGWPYLTRFGRF